MRKICLCAALLAATSLSVATRGAAQTDVQEAAGVEVPVPAARVEPVRPYQPGDHVWLSAPPPVTIASEALLSSGCQRVPATGYIGTNVYADSSAQYSNFWYWGAASSGQPFYWYVKRNDNSNADSGYSNGGNGSSSVGANIYHWKVQNKGSSPQAWNVCWDVL